MPDPALTRETLDEGERLCREATPGPMFAKISAGKREHYSPTVAVHDGNDKEIIAWPGFDSCDVPVEQWGANAELFAFAGTHLSSLLALARRHVDEEDQTPLRDLIQRIVKLEDEESRMLKDYPPGTVNAEDAWKEFGRRQAAAWDELRRAALLPEPTEPK